MPSIKVSLAGYVAERFQFGDGPGQIGPRLEQLLAVVLHFLQDRRARLAVKHDGFDALEQ